MSVDDSVDLEKKESKLQNDRERITRTFVDSIEQVVPGWIEKHEDTTDDIVSLGAGAGLEQQSLQQLFPKSRRTGVDRDIAGKIFHGLYGAEFARKDISDPSIYESKKVRLIISRNPGPAMGVGGVWETGFRLAWNKLEKDGVFYLTTREGEADLVKSTLEAAGVNNYVAFLNKFPLQQGGFSDSVVIIAHKK